MNHPSPLALRTHAKTVSVPDWFNRTLARSPVVGTTTVDGVPIVHRTWGADGNAGGVVLVHGGGAHSRWWDHVAPMLVERGRRVTAVDLSGHGDSGRRDRYDLDAWAGEVAAVVADDGFARPPVVVGHSMGGLVALRHGVRHPDGIAGTILIDCRTTPYSHEERLANEARAVGPLPRYPSEQAAMARFRLIPHQESLAYVLEHVARSSLREESGEWVWKLDPRIFGGQRDFDPQELAALGSRLWMVRAEKGMPAADIAGLGSAMPAVPTVEIPDAGHHVMLDRPLELVTVLRALLAAG